jgi:transcriptional regulator with XRE-family HTH domain
VCRANGFSGEFFRRERIAAGFSLGEFATLAEMDAERLLNIECGDVPTPDESLAMGRALFRCQSYRDEQKLLAQGGEILEESAA